MDHAKLFGVLVIGGAMLGEGCSGSAPSPVDAATSDAARRPTEDGGAQADAAMGAADGAALEECGFCPNVACCETGADGTPRERAGLVCCWGTSC